MVKLKYRNAVSVVEVSFESYMDLVYYVASNRIKDEDFVSITYNDEEIVGMDALCDKVMTKIEDIKAAKEVEEEDEYDEDDDDFYPEEEDEDEEECDACTFDTFEDDFGTEEQHEEESIEDRINRILNELDAEEAAIR